MTLADLSIKRPTFITCIVLLMIAVGIFSFRKLGVDLFPDVTFPVVTVSVPYPGAGPAEVESLITKPLEEELSTLSGVKRLTSISQEGVSVVISEFTLETDIKYAEQQIRDRIGSVKRKLPADINEPVIRRIDPADQPILIIALDAELGPADTYDLANEVVKPKLQQVNQVGLVDILGGRKREVKVELDRNKLKAREISATQVAGRLSLAGENVPAGKVETGTKEVVFRTLGQFNTIEDIKSTIITYIGNEVPVSVGDVATISDSLQDQKSIAYVNGKRSLFLNVYRQSGANTIAVTDAVKAAMEKINKELELEKGKAKLTMVRDGSVWIHANVDDVKESITLGTIMAIVVVYLFLGSIRSTIITGLALPNSLIGAFILMAAAGFSINIMTLLALSLAVGLLVDDAIVVRENIFRHIELGENPIEAARKGTLEVQLAVIATTLVVIAVFGPVAFLKGVVGQFFKQFGLTMCFAMAISLFDALTIAPMLSAYFAGSHHKGPKAAKPRKIHRNALIASLINILLVIAGVTTKVWKGTVGVVWHYTAEQLVIAFTKFQDWLEIKYENVLKFTVRRPMFVLVLSFIIFIACSYTVKYVPKTFLPPQDAGEFQVKMDLPPGTSLTEMNELALKAEDTIRQNPEVAVTALTVGNSDGESSVATIFVRLVGAKQRKMNTSEFKEALRGQLKVYSHANPSVGDYDAVGGGMRPFNVNIVGFDQKELDRVATALTTRLKDYPGLKDVDTNYRPGKPEVQISIDPKKVDTLGMSTIQVGQELRTQVEGAIPAKFRIEGREYDIRVRVKEDQRNIKTNFANIYVPNVNNFLVPLRTVALPIDATSPAKITRQDRGRYIQIQADITPGAGLSEIMSDISVFIEKDIKLGPGMKYAFVGQAENFKELGESMATALLFGVIFIFLVLASLYESFVTPFTIMLALPLAICGSFLALFISGQSLNLFSMIGTIMLLGIATKNSILLVDYANQLIAGGMERSKAIILSGKTRLRPILMTTMALIAGMIPVALGLNEASRQRTSMGISIIGGLISSTLLTLVVVPAAFSYIDRFRIWSKDIINRIVGNEPPNAKSDVK